MSCLLYTSNQSAELIHAFLVAEQIEKRVRPYDFHDAIHVVGQKAQGIFPSLRQLFVVLGVL